MHRERAERIRQLMDGYERKRLQQLRLALLLFRLSPAAAMQHAAMEVAHTGPSRMEAFLRQARAYRHVFNAYLERKWRGFGPWRAFFTAEGQVLKPRLDVSDMPHFQEAPSCLGDDVTRALPDIAILVLYNLALLSAAVFQFPRYDPR